MPRRGRWLPCRSPPRGPRQRRIATSFRCRPKSWPHAFFDSVAASSPSRACRWRAFSGCSSGPPDSRRTRACALAEPMTTMQEVSSARFSGAAPRIHSTGLRVAFAIVALLIAWLASASAFAAVFPRSGGRIAITLPNGRRGPLVLTPGQGGWVGTLSIANVGTEPLVVSRIAIRGDEDDVRSPSRLSVRFVDGAATSATLAPGASKEAIVAWMPDRDPRVRQAFGHVVATSSDEDAGEVAMGFCAQVPTGLGWCGDHALSLLVLLLLLVVLVAAGARLAGHRDERLVQRAAVGVASAELLLALWAYQRFSSDVGRADGNDGFQLVERAVWMRSIGVEWYVGVDGVSVALVLLAAILGLVGTAVVTRGPAHRRDEYFAAMALLMAGLVGAFVALDMVVLFAALQVVLIAQVMLLGVWGGTRSESAAAKLAMYGALGATAMLIAFIALSQASGHALLVDGTPVTHTMAIPELARTSFAAKDPILGLPFVDAVWLLLLVAAAVAAPIVPLHGWFPDALEEGPAGATIVVAGAVVALGPYLLVRVGLGAMPEGARWAGPSLSLLGVLVVVYGSLCAMAQRDLRGFVAYSSIANTGACLFGIGAFTPEGVAGGVVGLVAHGLAAAILLGVASAFEQRVRTCEMGQLGGLCRDAPGLGVLLALGLALSLGVPGFAGFWGLLLVLLGGSWPPSRVLEFALLAFAWLIASAAAHLRVARLVLFGPVHPDWRNSPYLQPSGGRLPDGAPNEIAALAPLAFLGLLLGLWPVPLMAQIADGVRDASAAVVPSLGRTTVDAPSKCKRKDDRWDAKDARKEH